MSETKKLTALTAKKGNMKEPVWEHYSLADVRALVEEYPLAWVCTGSGDLIEASLLPLIGIFDEVGQLTELIGHMAKSNPLYAKLSTDPGASILFKGPDAYISPEHAGRRDWAPTWNYAQVRVGAEIEFSDAETEYSLQVLTDAVESGRAVPWEMKELGARFDAMLSRIIGFRARVTSLSGKFKLGQEEDPEALQTILGALSDKTMVAWMQRFNNAR